MAVNTVRFLVSGRVQGVCYRASACDKANALALDGWVRNLADGRVELVAQGEAAAIEELSAWLWDGPPAARVSGVTVCDWNESVAAGFVVARDSGAG